MKKILKIIGYTLAGLILILITSALLIRFVFKEQMIAYTSKLEEKERIELLRNATPYALSNYYVMPHHTLPIRHIIILYINKTRFRHKRYARISALTPY